MPPASGLVAPATPRIQIDWGECYAKIVHPALIQVKAGKIAEMAGKYRVSSKETAREEAACES